MCRVNKYCAWTSDFVESGIVFDRYQYDCCMDGEHKYSDEIRVVTVVADGCA